MGYGLAAQERAAREVPGVYRKTGTVGAPPRSMGLDPASRARSAGAGLPEGVAFPVSARRPETRRWRSGL